MTEKPANHIESILSQNRRRWMQIDQVVGVGLSEIDGQPVIKIFAEKETDIGIPSNIDGIPIVFDVAGKIVKQLSKNDEDR